MLRSTFLSLVAVSQLGMAVVAQETKSITEADSVIAIFTNDWGCAAPKGPQLIVSIWGDGTVVWSNDQLNGGHPYLTAQLRPKDVSAALKRFADLGVFDIPRLKQPNFGPDSSFTTILLRYSGKELKMDSWHELYESNGKVIAAAHGLTGLDGKKLLPALAEQPADYLHYRMTWLELRLAAANLIPKSGRETSGVPTMLRGKLSWQSGKDE
jgi:hypothetical protein